MSNAAWIDELIRWQDRHPEWEPFKEDTDSQRQQLVKERW